MLLGGSVALVVALGLPAVALALPTGETWGAELAIAGGDDENVALVNGAVRLVDPSAATRRSTGVLMLAPRRPAAATNAVTADLTADLPPGTAVGVDVRGIRSDGTWSDWVAAGDTAAGPPAVLPETTNEVQVRLRLLGGPGLVSPAVLRLWLATSVSRTAPSAAAPSPIPPTTTPPRTTPPAAPTTTPPTASAPPVGSTVVSTMVPIVPTERPGPATSTSATAPASELLWSADVTAQGLGRFKDTPHNIVGGKGEKPTVGVVDASGSPGRKAVRMTMPAGGTRAEVEPNVANLLEGQDRFFRLSVRLAPGFPTDPRTWQAITQWKNDGTGSPPLEIRVEDGAFVLGGGFGHPGGPKTFRLPIGAAPVNRVVDLMVHVRFSRDPAQGVVDVWTGGQQVITAFHPPGGTLYPGGTGSLFSYWKIGIYRDSEIVDPAGLEVSDARVGTSARSVTASRP